MGDVLNSETLLLIAAIALSVAILAMLVILTLIRRGRAHRVAPAAGVSRLGRPSEFEPPAPVLTDGARAALIGKEIEKAAAAGQKATLAGLYLDLANTHEKLGNVDARMEALRAAAGCGSLHGPRSAHAEARLQLGEAAYAAGDLASACEQWQLARTAFLEDGQKDRHARVEKRMRDNGCPTDWVLTDF